jgi:GT2 family glycosyltransferase
VVDDNSTDATPAIVDGFVASHPHLCRYIALPYSGLSVGRNRAITDGRGDLMCFIDDDAVAERTWIREMVAAANRHPDVECFGGRLLLRLEGKPPRTCGVESLGAHLDLGDDEQPIEHMKGANMAIRRSAFQRIGLFNPALVWRGDEYNWIQRLHEADGRALYVPQALVWHRRLPSDLRLWNLLKTRFGWGIGEIQYRRETGIPFDRVYALKGLKWQLAHAYRARCIGGLLGAAVRLGELWGATFGELRKPQAAAPTLAPREDTPERRAL